MTEQADEWFRYAEEDFSAAEGLADSHPTIAAYHAHQAAEKALKGLQIELEGDYERTHDLVRLYHQLAVPDEFRSVLEDLNPADTAARYPDAPDVTIDQLQTTLNEVEDLLTWIQRRLNE